MTNGARIMRNTRMTSAVILVGAALSYIPGAASKPECVIICLLVWIAMQQGFNK